MGFPKTVVAEMIRDFLRPLLFLRLCDRLPIARMRRPRPELVLCQPLSDQNLREAQRILGILELAWRDALQNGDVGPIQSPGVDYFLLDLLHPFEQCIRRESFSLVKNLSVDRSQS